MLRRPPAPNGSEPLHAPFAWRLWERSPRPWSDKALYVDYAQGAYLAGVDRSFYGGGGFDVSAGPLIVVKNCPGGSKSFSIGGFASGATGGGLGAGISAMGGYYPAGEEALRGISFNATSGVGPVSGTVVFSTPSRPSYGGPVITLPGQSTPTEILGYTGQIGRSAPLVNFSGAFGQTYAGTIGGSCPPVSKSQK
jgi:hypothetical protein